MSGSGKPLVTAHTGCENSPKNTIASVFAGIEAGADVMEIDVRTTSDGMPVLIHDPFLTDPSGECLYISDHTFTEVQRFAEQCSGFLTTLEEVLEIVKTYQCMLNLDLKDIDSINYIRKAVSEFGVCDNIIISGCESAWVQTITSKTPRLQVLLNAYYSPALEDVKKYAEYTKTLCKHAIESGCCGINIDFAMCREELVEQARKRFLPISVWTVDRDEDMLNMLHTGVFAITTYYPKRLLQLIEQE